MPLSRRSFLRSGTLAAVATAALGPQLPAFALGLSPATPRAAGQTPDGLTRSAFESYVGGVFRGSSARGNVSLTLLGVEGYEPGTGTRIAQARARRTDTFTLTFAADRPLGTASATHTLEHGALGRFDLFMTGGDAGPLVYQAVINRLV